MTENILNLANTGWQTGKYPLFLGEELGLHDTVNRPYPQLFDLYKKLKSLDWAEDEVNLQQARMEFKRCDKSSYEVMIKTLSWQWEQDSVASRSIIALFAPFVSNSELTQLLVRWTDSECLHATTYSEIVRQCIEDPDEVFREIVNNEAITNRSVVVAEVFSNLKILGAKYTLDKSSVDLKEVRQHLLKAVVALYCLEAMEFMASFACTFALAERDLFLTPAALVQKIMIDETIHAEIDEAILDILMADPVWNMEYKSIEGEVAEIVGDIYAQELAWSEYIFSEGRSVVGLTTPLLIEWVQYKAQVVYNKLGLPLPFQEVSKNPLPWMDVWLDIDGQQVAAQETDVTNYRLNSLVLDHGVGKAFDFGASRGEPTALPYKVYSKNTCPYCVKVKSFMELNGIKYQEILVEEEDLTFLLERGLRSVPQVFDQDNNYIGDCTKFIEKFS